jgi:biopolymer transport protein ExbD
MGFAVGGKRGIVSDPNIVPLIDVLLVLRVIFMLMPPFDGAPGANSAGVRGHGT